MKTAIRPSYFESFTLPSLKKEEKVDDDAEITALYSLSNHSGWKILKEYVERIKEDLDQLTIKQMEQGVSLEEIGKSTVVKEITKDVLRKIINKVEDARESIERRGKDSGGVKESGQT